MKRSDILAIIVGILVLVTAMATYAQKWQRIPGKIGSSANYGSGWIDLAPPSDFKKGERLRLAVGGSATKVLIRLLRRGESSDDAVGIIGQYNISPSRNVVITLTEDISSVIHISVHGGPNPWGKFPLGGGNGPATLLSVERDSP